MISKALIGNITYACLMAFSAHAGRPCRMDGGTNVYSRLDSVEVSKRVNPFTRFPDLFLIDADPCHRIENVPGEFGRSSTRYAKQAGAYFRRVKIQDVFEMRSRDLDWRHLDAFFDLGTKLKHPGSPDSLARMVDGIGAASARRSQAVHGMPSGDPWFGLFYKDNCGKSYIYGIQYKPEKDSMKIVFQEIYFTFDVPVPNDMIICNASGIYHLEADSLKWIDVKRIEAWVEENKDPEMPEPYLSDRPLQDSLARARKRAGSNRP
jgi:hypothetical protein